MYDRSKKCAYRILVDKKLYKKLTLEDLYKIIDDKGFKIIEYKKYNYSEELRIIIERLNLEKEIQEKDSFFYCSDHLKFIFLNEDISYEDKCIMLSHEIAHICDERIFESELTYTNAQKENFANEFVHYLNKPSNILKSLIFLIRKPLPFVIASIILIVTLSGVMLNENHNLTHKGINAVNLSRNSHSNVYYITSTGKKYHKSFCKHIKYKTNIRNLSFEDATKEGYLPCLDCIGEEL